MEAETILALVTAVAGGLFGTNGLLQSRKAKRAKWPTEREEALAAEVERLRAELDHERADADRARRDFLEAERSINADVVQLLHELARANAGGLEDSRG